MIINDYPIVPCISLSRAFFFFFFYSFLSCLHILSSYISPSISSLALVHFQNIFLMAFARVGMIARVGEIRT